MALAGLGACSDRFSELDPRPAFANLFGAHLEGREPPPGLDQPWPNLSSVPARPTPPSVATRESLSAALARNRAESRDPLQPPARRAGAGVEGPPAPPRLVAAPAVRFEAPPASRPAPAALPAQPAAPQPAPARPATAPIPAGPPPAPAPDLLAAPPPPGADLLAPPPPPGRDLLAPRRD